MGPFPVAEGGAPTVILLAVTVLALIVLANSVLIVVVSMTTFDATNRIFPLVVTNSPEVFVMELVAIRLFI
jgi:hypothetical protein